MGVIDSDFRCARAQIATIVEYIPKGWREFLRLGDMPGALGSVWALPETIYQTPQAVEAKKDDGKSDIWGRSWATATDEITDPASGSAFLDRHGIVRAIINPGTAPNLSSLWNPALGATVATAINDWQLDTWLAADERFAGSIIVGPRDPKEAAEEIARVAPSGRMAQVIVAFPPHLIGNRFYAPVHEVANEFGLTIALQAGGAYTGGNRGMTGAGFPGSVFEYELGWESAAHAHLISAVVGGLFERYPNVKLVLNGFGIGWLPGLLLKLDMEYEAGRIEVPATLTRLPSEHVAESVRFTTDVFASATENERLVKLLELADASKLLLYASGSRRLAPEALSYLPSEWRTPVLHDNARQLFRLDPVAA